MKKITAEAINNYIADLEKKHENFFQYLMNSLEKKQPDLIAFLGDLTSDEFNADEAATIVSAVMMVYDLYDHFIGVNKEISYEFLDYLNEMVADRVDEIMEMSADEDVKSEAMIQMLMGDSDIVEISAFGFDFINNAPEEFRKNISEPAKFTATLAVKTLLDALTLNEEDFTDEIEAFYEDMDEELDEEEQYAADFSDEFMESDLYKNLDEKFQVEGEFILQTFSECMIRFYGLSFKEWDLKSSVECCTETLTAKITAGREYYEALPAVISAFFRYAQSKGEIPNGEMIGKAIEKKKDEIISNSENREKWDPVKSVMMKAVEDGIDLEDEDALNEYLLKLSRKGSDDEK